jgi:hypothetical protein
MAPAAINPHPAPNRKQKKSPMSTITTKNGTEIYYKN